MEKQSLSSSVNWKRMLVMKLYRGSLEPLLTEKLDAFEFMTRSCNVSEIRLLF